MTLDLRKYSIVGKYDRIKVKSLSDKMKWKEIFNLMDINRRWKFQRSLKL